MSTIEAKEAKVAGGDQYRLRFDFVISDLRIIDEDAGLFEFVMVPNPERYERKEIGGEQGWFDKFDNSFLPDHVFNDLANQAVGLPMYAHFPGIEDIDDYLHERRLILEQAIDSPADQYVFHDASEELLQQLENARQYFAIISCDLVGSTKLSQNLSAEENAKIISLFSKEIAVLSPRFHSFVLKFMGDGAIIYLPEPNIIGKVDLALDFALCLRRVVLEVINPVLEGRSLPTLGIRIGIDAGEAVITAVGSPESKSHKDLIGETVNLAAKIQSRAEPNTILVGEAGASMAHTQWRKCLTSYQPQDDWGYIDRRTGENYQLYLLDV